MNLCARAPGEIRAVLRAVGKRASEDACNAGAADCENLAIQNLVACGSVTLRDALDDEPADPGSRSLQDGTEGTWQVAFDIVVTTPCGFGKCRHPQDAANAKAIATGLSDAVVEAVQSGALLTALQNDGDVLEVFGAEALGCAVAWGGSSRATGTLTDITGNEVGHPLVTYRYYPHFTRSGGTCRNDGNEPSYMETSPSLWFSDSLDACCNAHFEGWNEPQCMNERGSGLWYVDFRLNKCRTDCAESGGPSCGGIANLAAEDLFPSPLACCESKLDWVFHGWCEADSFGSACYCGTDLWYSGTNSCVKDCDVSCSNGDVTCGGIVKTADMAMYESASLCCEANFDWIENELCVTRSNKATVAEKYWPDMGKSRCFKDSETPATDLSVSVYDTLEECCGAVPWVALSVCLALAETEE